MFVAAKTAQNAEGEHGKCDAKTLPGSPKWTMLEKKIKSGHACVLQVAKIPKQPVVLLKHFSSLGVTAALPTHPTDDAHQWASHVK